MAHVGNAMVACPGRFHCQWVKLFRHAPHKGLERKHTLNSGNARYLPGTSWDTIRAIETATAANPTFVISPAPNAEYVREAGQVIGWDRGEEATLSFVECTSRFFHGRPMAPQTAQLRGVP